jgi:hypothetical protein
MVVKPKNQKKENQRKSKKKKKILHLQKQTILQVTNVYSTI